MNPTRNTSITPTMNPTKIPALQPSSAPTKPPSNNPTITPSYNPSIMPPNNHSKTSTISPSKYPTTPTTIIIGSKWKSPTINNVYLVSDPFSRFEAIIEISITNEDASIFSVNCKHCFIWQYKQKEQNEWITINDKTATHTIYNTAKNQNNNIITSTFVIQSIRRQNGGYCFTEHNDRILQTKQQYEFMLQIVSKSNLQLLHQTDSLNVITNALPNGGYCDIKYDRNDSNIKPIIFRQFNLHCEGWNAIELEYNVLMNNVLLSDHFVNNATDITGLIGAGNNLKIVALIKDQNYHNAISCFSIKIQNATFVTIQNETVAQTVKKKIQNITQTDEFCGNKLHVAVAVHSTIQELNNLQLTTKHENEMLTGGLVNNVINCSIIYNSETEIANITDEISFEDIIQEIITVSSITSSICIISEETNLLLIDAYLPRIFDVIQYYFSDTNNETSAQSTQHQLYTLMSEMVIFMHNMELILMHNAKTSAINSSAYNELFQYLTDSTTLASSLSLYKSLPGETFSLVIPTDNKTCNGDTKFNTIIRDKCVESRKYEINNNDTYLCGCNGQQQVSLPNKYHNKSSIYCSVIVPSYDGLILTNNDNITKLRSDIIVIDIYLNNENMLNEELLLKSKQVTNECDPYFITFSLDQIHQFDLQQLLTLENDSDWKTQQHHNNNFVSCDFWNITNNEWESNGCYVYDINKHEGYIICKCVHLSTFSVSLTDFFVDFNELTVWHWRQLTIKNLRQYPTVWMTIVSIFVLLIMLCLLSTQLRNRENRSLLAYEDVIYKSIRDEKIIHDISGKEIKYISAFIPNPHKLGHGLKVIAPDCNSKKQLCYLVFRLYKVYIRNEHTLLALLKITSGTNFSVQQRLGLLFMDLCTIIAMSAAFYGIKQKTVVGDITASFLISFVATFPAFVAKKLFQKSKPRTIETHKEYTATQSSRSAISLQSKSGTSEPTKMETVHQEIHELTKQQSIAQTNLVKLASDIRLIIFNQTYPFPSKCKKITWIIIIVWTVFFCLIAILYGIQFDLRYIVNDTKIHGTADECPNISLAHKIETKLNEEYIKSKQNSLYSEHFDNYNYNDENDSKTWLFSLIQSFVTSIFIWQPLLILVLTFLKVWMFSHYLPMNIAPGNICKLCTKACCCCSSNDQPNNTQQNDKLNMLQQEMKLVKMNSHQKNSTSEVVVNDDRIVNKQTKFIANPNRPLDILAFLANDELFIDDYDIEIADHLKCMKPNKMLQINANVNSEIKHGHEIEMQEIEMKKIENLIDPIDDNIGNKCENCGSLKKGEIDTDDGFFCCVECWEEYNNNPDMDIPFTLQKQLSTYL
eukprot:495344_1